RDLLRDEPGLRQLHAAPSQPDGDQLQPWWRALWGPSGAAGVRMEVHERPPIRDQSVSIPRWAAGRLRSVLQDLDGQHDQPARWRPHGDAEDAGDGHGLDAPSVTLVVTTLCSRRSAAS